MHLIRLFFSFLFLLPLVPANPTPDDDHGHGNDDKDHRRGCLTDVEAREVAMVWANFYVDPSTLSNTRLVDKYLAEDLQVFSDTINWITPGADRTPGAVTNPNRANFIAVNQVAGPVPPFTTLNVWHGCHSITFRWRWEITPAAAIGIDVLELEPGSYRIRRDYSEWNALAFLQNNGCQLSGGICG